MAKKKTKKTTKAKELEEQVEAAKKEETPKADTEGETTSELSKEQALLTPDLEGIPEDDSSEPDDANVEHLVSEEDVESLYDDEDDDVSLEDDSEEDLTENKEEDA